MKYIMLIYETAQNLESRKDGERDPYVAAWRAYHKALIAAGAYVGETNTRARSAVSRPSPQRRRLPAAHSPIGAPSCSSSARTRRSSPPCTRR